MGIAAPLGRALAAVGVREVRATGVGGRQAPANRGARPARAEDPAAERPGRRKNGGDGPALPVRRRRLRRRHARRSSRRPAHEALFGVSDRCRGLAVGPWSPVAGRDAGAGLAARCGRGGARMASAAPVGRARDGWASLRPRSALGGPQRGAGAGRCSRQPTRRGSAAEPPQWPARGPCCARRRRDR